MTHSTNFHPMIILICWARIVYDTHNYVNCILYPDIYDDMHAYIDRPKSLYSPFSSDLLYENDMHTEHSPYIIGKREKRASFEVT